MRIVRKALWALLAASLLPSPTFASETDRPLQEIASEEDILIEETVKEAKEADQMGEASEAEAAYGMEVFEPEKKFVIPQGTAVMEDEEVVFDPKNIVEISTDDARCFIQDRFIYWAFEKADKGALASITQDLSHLGDCGRFYVPDLGVSVALYYANEMNAPFAQQIVDEEDAGVYTPHLGGEPYLADHASQAFGGLHYCREGMMAYWKHVDRIDLFYCTRTCNGENDGLFIYDDKGENCFYLNEGGMFTYTCNEDWQHVSIAFWLPVGTLWL